MIVFVFWLLIALLLYTYLLYPFILGTFSVIKRIATKKIIPSLNKEHLKTSFSIIIPAYNEAKHIAQKIENTLQLDYPTHLIEIIIVADGCTDNTINITQSFSNIKVIVNEERLGKSQALNVAMSYASNEIAVFTDANAFLNSKCLQYIALSFLNTKTGGVACEKKISNPFIEHLVSNMEGLYWKYESVIKNWESQVHSVIGAAGELFCIRTSLYTPLNSNVILDDFILSSTILKKGYSISYQKKALASEPATTSLYEEAKRKVRIGAGAAQSLKILGLFPYKNVWLNIQFISRRVIRWVISPLGLIVIFFANFYIVQHGAIQLYSVLFFAQLCFYILTFIGLIFHWLKQTNKLALTPFYFVFMNICMLIGFISYMLNFQTVFWKKSKRIT